MSGSSKKIKYPPNTEQTKQSFVRGKNKGPMKPKACLLGKRQKAPKRNQKTFYKLK